VDNLAPLESGLLGPVRLRFGGTAFRP
jgi:hypothetical protein